MLNDIKLRLMTFYSVSQKGILSWLKSMLSHMPPFKLNLTQKMEVNKWLPLKIIWCFRENLL